MKYLLLGIVSILISANIFARDTNSMRSSTELVKLGDSEASLLQKMGKPKPRFCAISFNKWIAWAIKRYGKKRAAFNELFDE